MVRRPTLSCFALAMLLGGTAVNVSAQQPSSAVYGNLGYFYGFNQADGGSSMEDSTVVGSIGGRTHIWQPWFADLGAGATFSVGTTQNENISSEAQVTSGNVNLGLFPVSRFPFRLSFHQTERDYDWENRHTNDNSFFRHTRTRSVTLRQSLIGSQGTRLDGWYNVHWRDYNDFNDDNPKYDTEDGTFGLKFKHRGKHQNLFINATQQDQDNSDVDKVSKNTVVSLTHNYFPVSSFYIKTLASEAKYEIENKSKFSNQVFQASSDTTNDQLTSLFYWRPEFKPYTATGAVRIHRRNVDFGITESAQDSLNANVAMNYQVNRKTRLSATAAVSSLTIDDADDNGVNVASDEDNDNNSLGANVGLSALYQSDRYLLKRFTWYWFADAGVQEEVTAQYEDTDNTNVLNAALGHSGSRQWNTGNRSTLRLSAQQSMKETRKLGKIDDESLLLVHTGTLAWSENLRRGSSYAQLTVIDSRDVADKGDNQVANFQLSRNMPIDRLSSWGGNVSSQTTRRDAGDGSTISLTTSSTAQINYQHTRLFGIYRLKFRTELEGTSIDNRTGADRLKAEWEGRLSYRIGKLNTALFLRAMENDSGVGNRMGVFQINRAF